MAAGGQRRSAARLDVSGAERRELRRPARLRRRGRHPRQRSAALRLRLRRPDARLPAAVHLSAVRSRGVLRRCTWCRSACWPSRGRSASSPRCTAWCGSACDCSAAPITAWRCSGPRSASGPNRCAAPSTTARSTSSWCWRCSTPSTARRWWLSGLLVGLAAGVKLTPAVSGSVLPRRAAVGVPRCSRRWCSSRPSACRCWCSATRPGYYFTDLLGDASRVGPIGTSFNQSWRGGISRILGHDAGYGPPVLVALAVTAVLAVLAWRAVGGRRPARARSSSCSCSVCCCRRSRGRTTGCG